MKHLIFPTAILILIFIASCYNDSQEALYPSEFAVCDTANVTFSKTITSILSDNCWGCHSNATAAPYGNKIRIETYADVKSQINAIISSINHTGTVHPMPHDGQKLRTCLLTQFDIWVREGMPDN